MPLEPPLDHNNANSEEAAPALGQKTCSRPFESGSTSHRMATASPFISRATPLGLQPKGARDIIDGELEDWRRYGVEAHFEGRRPWVAYHRRPQQTSPPS